VILPFIAECDESAGFGVPFSQGPIITQKMPVVCTEFAVRSDACPLKDFNLKRFVGGGSLHTTRDDAHHSSSGGFTVKPAEPSRKRGQADVA
jgi:hypothetical protein